MTEPCAPYGRYLPADLDPTDVDALQRVYDALERRDVSTRTELERFLLDWDELGSLLSEAQATAYGEMTADTTRADFAARYARIVERIVPLAEERDFRLKRRVLASPAVEELGPPYRVFLRNLRAEVDLYREENLPLMAEDLGLCHEFERISGGQQAELRGEILPLPRLAPLLEEPDRALREEAWRVRAQVQAADAGALEDLYDRMLRVRGRIAAHAGLPSYRDYRFLELRRFDYAPEDCFALHEAIERHVVPAIVADQERRRAGLGLDTLRPWDLHADPEGRAALRPFDTAEALRDGCGRIFARMDPELGALYEEMVRAGTLDLESRPGKTPTGYMQILHRRRLPFIFMSAVGSRRDLEILLHESGHAFNYSLARHHPLRSDRFPDTEFAEVGSMAMELLARPYLAEVYGQEALERLMDEQLVSALSLLPRLALTDAFQHWTCTHPGHTVEERRAKWLELENRFRPGIDWSGLEDEQAIGWHFYHVFVQPFYFIEYAIAQLAALRIWLRSLEDERGALAAYKRALALGGSRPLPELFRAAGVDFAFDDGTVREVVEATAARVRRWG